LIEIDADDRVVSLARLAEKEDENGSGLAGGTSDTEESN
jgi:hypothetical protein